MKDLFDLHDKVAFVAGGAGYLGAHVCRALAKHGATVLVADINEDAARQVSTELTDQECRSYFKHLNIADEREVTNTITEIVKEHGSLDIAVNLTFSSAGKQLDHIDLEAWQQGTAVTLDGAFNFSMTTGRLMLKSGGGSIIQFASMYGIVSPEPGLYGDSVPVNPMDYGVSKAGVLQMTRYQAIMWAPHKVRVNAVVPGPFPNTTNYTAKEERAFIRRLGKHSPMGRLGRPEEICGAVVYLASDASSYVTGTQIAVDGGWTAR